jgi:pimeloyl-ACP methyl ester carboxylesterase
MSAPLPPVELPPGRVVLLPGRGEVVVRDTGTSDPTRPTVLLLHGWMFSADTNWFTVYGALSAAGHRVVALDHRGHGRGLRTSEPFRLEDCAADAAALLRELDAAPAVAVGYSMGGPIAQLLARDHPEAVAGLVLCATAADWQDWYMKGFWRTMGAIRLGLGLFPVRAWRWLLASARVPPGPEREWVAAELSRGSSVDLAEAGRELSRFDARPWLGRLAGVPAAVVVTTRDPSVLPRKQRRLAEALGADVFEVRGDHVAVTSKADAFRAALLAALRAVSARGASASPVAAA